MPFAVVSSVRIHYAEAGIGKPLFLLHGNANSGLGWRKVILALARRYRVIAHDRSGFGQSEEREWGEFGPRAYAGELAGFMDALGIRKAHVCGLSFGGMVAQCFALDFPDRLYGLILAGTTPDRTGRDVAETIAELERDGWKAVAERLTQSWFGPDADPADIAETYEIALQSTQRMRERTVRALGSFDIKNEVPTIKAPTFVVAGEHDTTNPPGHVELLRDLIPKARLIVVPDSGHMIPVEQPDAFAENVMAFLEEIDRPA